MENILLKQIHNMLVVHTLGLPNVSANGNTIQTILQIVFGALGGLALVYIVLGGFSYIISAGDPEKAAKGRKMITYAVLGIILALTGEALVTWVLGSVL